MEINNIQSFFTQVKNAVQKEKQKPLIVAVMGQTGVGKTSLVNALFGTTLQTDAVRPCTTEVQLVVNKGIKGGELWFYDLPGFGEIGKDADYLFVYKDKLVEADIVLWAIHADTRSISFDKESLDILLKSFNPTEYATILGKITIVLTKADLIIPSPWILTITDKDDCIFVPTKKTTELLQQKAQYFWESFFTPYKNLIGSQAPYEGHFSVSFPGFSSNEHYVFYQGMIDQILRDYLSTQYPQYTEIFERLYNHHSVITCSSHFRYNLDLLMLAIIDKIGDGVSFRLGNFLQADQLNRLALSEAQHFCNLIVFNQKQKKIIFDLSKEIVDHLES